MAILSALHRFARLGFWVGLSAGAMVVDACSSGLKGKAQDAAPEVDGGALDSDNARADGGQSDLWDIICE